MEDLNLEKLHFLGQDVDSAVKVVRDRKVGSTITKNKGFVNFVLSLLL